MIDNHPADELFAKLIVKLAPYSMRAIDNPFPEIKQWLHDFYDRAFEEGQEDKCNADKGLGGTR